MISIFLWQTTADNKLCLRNEHLDMESDIKIKILIEISDNM